MRRLSYCLFILAVFLLAPLLALPRQRQADPAPTAVPTATAAPAAVPYRAVAIAPTECQHFCQLSPFKQAVTHAPPMPPTQQRPSPAKISGQTAGAAQLRPLIKTST